MMARIIRSDPPLRQCRIARFNFFNAWGLLTLFLLPISAMAAERNWPGLPPDCWKESRYVHGQGDWDWKANVNLSHVKAGGLKNGVVSPNKGYSFLFEGGRPDGKLTIDAEKDYLIIVEFKDLFGLADIRWVNEKLIFMRPWWGRIAATDLIFDVEAEKFVWSESLVDAYLAHQQYQESCLELGCDCIKQQ